MFTYLKQPLGHYCDDETVQLMWQCFLASHSCFDSDYVSFAWQKYEHTHFKAHHRPEEFAPEPRSCSF